VQRAVEICICSGAAFNLQLLSQ